MADTDEKPRTVEELETLLNNALAENQTLQEKYDLLEVKFNSQKEQLSLAQKGLRLANLDSMPKEVADDARRRMQMGLGEQAAIQKALEQYEHNKKIRVQEARRPGAGAEADNIELSVAALLVDNPNIGELKGELFNRTGNELTGIIEALNSKGAKIATKKGPQTKVVLIGLILEGAQVVREALQGEKEEKGEKKKKDA